jgi:hypothetical protein
MNYSIGKKGCKALFAAIAKGIGAKKPPNRGKSGQTADAFLGKRPPFESTTGSAA